jgi:hypothetical protein
MKRATWVNGKRRVTGEWRYHWGSDTFVIVLDGRNRLTGRPNVIYVKGEEPEWGNWKREAGR